MAYSTISKSSSYFNTQLYTGNGSTNAQTGIGFQPDMTWIKSRSNNTDHVITDAVRGVTKEIRPNKTDYEDTASNGLTAFGTDGFTVGDWTVVNLNSETYSAWNWKANGSGSSNSDGTITSTVSANSTNGVSIIKYTGTGSNATIGHGLGVAPTSVIIKKLNTAADWVIGNNGMGGWNYVMNFTTGQRANQTGQFQSTAPSSSVITLGTEGQVNGSGDTFICYAFAPITGFSKFAGYTGNGNTSGPFVYTGFKPSFLIVKGATVTDNWSMFDNKNLGYNAFNQVMYPDLNLTQSNGLPIDFLSNGFKFRSSAAMVNGNGQEFIYMAFGQPIVSTNNVIATAR